MTMMGKPQIKYFIQISNLLSTDLNQLVKSQISITANLKCVKDRFQSNILNHSSTYT